MTELQRWEDDGGRIEIVIHNDRSSMTRFTPKNWYALGTLRPTGWFNARKFVSGRLMARYEKREGEKAIPVIIMTKDDYAKLRARSGS
jgi:hypothetical protein